MGKPQPSTALHRVESFRFLLEKCGKPRKCFDYTDGGERSVTPGGTGSIRQALKGRWNAARQLGTLHSHLSPLRGQMESRRPGGCEQRYAGNCAATMRLVLWAATASPSCFRAGRGRA